MQRLRSRRFDSCGLPTILAVLGTAIVLLGCSSSETATRVGFYPVEVSGVVSRVAGCDGLGFSEDAPVLLDLTGQVIVVEADFDFDIDCRGTIAGPGVMKIGPEGSEVELTHDFSIAAADECADLDEVNYSNLALVAMSFVESPPATPLSCVNQTNPPLGPRLECVVDTSCTFNILDPVVIYRFNLTHELQHAIYDALY